jgi:hypothetical protein
MDTEMAFKLIEKYILAIVRKQTHPQIGFMCHMN